MSNQAQTGTRTTTDTFKCPMGSDPLAAFVRIGTVRTTQELTRRTSEATACNYDVITVSAGTGAEIQTNGYWIKVALPGTITASSWTDRLLSEARTATDERVGRSRPYCVQDYAYDAAEAIIAGRWLEGADVRLDDGVRILAQQVDFGERGIKFMYDFAIAV